MDVRTKSFQITKLIWLGPFASPERKPALLAANISHILNVSEAPNVLTAENDSFRSVVWHPIVDLEIMPQESATDCVLSLHRMLSDFDSRVYVHCIAGLNRSPTILWLYFLACGITPEAAKQMIENRSPDSIAPHPKLVDANVIRAVRELGQTMLLPHPRPEALIPAD